MPDDELPAHFTHEESTSTRRSISYEPSALRHHHPPSRPSTRSSLRAVSVHAYPPSRPPSSLDGTELSRVVVHNDQHEPEPLHESNFAHLHIPPSMRAPSPSMRRTTTPAPLRAATPALRSLTPAPLGVYQYPTLPPSSPTSTVTAQLYPTLHHHRTSSGTSEPSDPSSPTSPTSPTSLSKRPPSHPTLTPSQHPPSFAIPDALKSSLPSHPPSSSSSSTPYGPGDSVAFALPFTHLPLYSALLLLTTLTLLLAMLIYSSGFAPPHSNPMLGPDPSTLLHFGAKFTPIQLNHAQHWRPFVSTLLYAGFVHIALGFVTGMPFMIYLERTYGTPRVFFVWVTAGWAGQLWSSLFGPTLIGVGGTTAMAGIIGAYWAHLALTHQVHKQAELRMGVALSCAAFGLLLIFGIFPFVNQWGHLAGALVGFLVGLPALAGVVRDGEGVRVWKPRLVVPAVCVLLTLIIVVGYYFYSEDRPYSWCERCHWVECIDTNSWDCSPPDIPQICFQEPLHSYDVNDDTLTHGWC